MRPAAIAISTALFGAAVLLAVQARAQAQDRYGPETATTQTLATAGVSTLTWPGKTAPAPPPAAPAPPAPQPVAVVAAPPPPAPPPVPVVAAAAAPAQPLAAQTGLPPHRYSVDRQYGVQPDPIPLPAQFFANSAATDLAAPPPPLPPRPIPGSQTVSSTASANTPANRARAIALDTAGPDDGGQ
jgi:hypothetical protein